MGLRDRFKKVFGQDKKEDEKTVRENESSDEVVFKDSETVGEIKLLSDGKVLFVCSGNTDRSPMAEAIFNQKATGQKAFSAGLFAQNGGEASQNAVTVCANHGIDLSGHKTRYILDFPVEDMDLILAVTVPIRDALKMQYPNSKIFTIKEYAGGYSDLDIMDPFGEDLSSYEECFLEIEGAISKILGVNEEGKDKQSELIELESPEEVKDINNFRQLDNQIKTGINFIELTSDIVLHDSEVSDYSNGIGIDVEGLVIDGNGHTIDACGKSRIFNIFSNNITIKNIILKNGFHSDGGAINNNRGANLILENCVLIQNAAKEDGGAIINFGQISARDVNFETNIVKENSGGAINNQKGAKICLEDCIFGQNTAENGNGGAISSWGEIILKSCDFSGNFSKKFGGTIINWEGEIVLNDCSFGENRSDTLGGAIVNLGKVRCAGVNFADNFASMNGGAVNNQSSGDIVFEDCVFSGNAADGEAGAIINLGKVSCEGVNFTNNVAKSHCGAINNQGELILNDCIFSENRSDTLGGAILNLGKVRCTGVNFADNFASMDGGAVNNQSSGDIVFEDCVFSGNAADGEAGAIINLGKVSCEGVNFTNNVAKSHCGAINNQGELILNDCIFSENRSDTLGGAIVNLNKLSCTGVNFANNVASMDGGAVNNQENAEAVFYECVFMENVSKQHGEAICNGGHTNLKNCIFKNNIEDSDRIIYTVNDDNLVMVDCEFNDNINFEDKSVDLIKKPTTFKELNEFIHSGVKKIVLGSDIVLEEGMQINYGEGIKIDVDGLVIDGNGHAIDAKGKSRIFIVNAENISIKNITLKNGYSKGNSGGAIFKGALSSLDIINSNFIGNKSDGNGGAIYCNSLYGGGSHPLEIKDSNFENNSSRGCGGAVYQSGSSNFISVKFTNNSSKEGGALGSDGKLSIHDGYFMGNSSKLGGAIINLDEGDMTIEDCVFKENGSDVGCALYSSGKIIAKRSDFIKNTSNDKGAVYNDGNFILENCKFTDNISYNGASALLNFGTVSLKDCNFNKNVSKHYHGAVNNQKDGELTADNCAFNDNEGCAILSWGKITTSDTKFIKNSSESPGAAIYLLLGATLYCTNCDFEKNWSALIGSIVHNECEDAKFINCNFSQHRQKGYIVFNENDLTLINCTFKDNEDLESVIFSNADSMMELSGGKIANNVASNSAIHNMSKNFTISDTKFKNNISTASKYAGDILNEGNLNLHSPKFKSDSLSVLNYGNIDVKNLSHDEIEKTIKNNGNGIINKFLIPDGDIYDFSYLNKLMQENSKVISLQNDISIENYELDFFEGGIEIVNDDVVLDGKGHVIDARKRTRIFNVLGKNVTIKNLIFKNGYVSNKYAHHTTGGGAVKITKDSTLTVVDCQFIGNVSDNDGGAIQNNGKFLSKNNEYIENESKYNGGAIHNRGYMVTTDDKYQKNNAKIAGSIYNNRELIINRNISLLHNNSDFKQDIYNADTINTENANIDLKGMIFNTYGGTDDWESFKYLADRLNDSNEITLQRDIKLEHGNVESDEIVMYRTVFDGNNHIIDLNHFNLNFIVKGKSIFKNIIFKNADIHKNSLFEIITDVKFENVKFINNRIRADNNLIKNRGKVEITDSNFYNNSSKNGSLIRNIDELTILNSDFINNESQSLGTVIFNKNKAKKILIDNSNFQNNYSARDGGVLYSDTNASFEVKNSTFTYNHAKIDGGVIFNRGKFTLLNCILTNNLAKNGGAIYSLENSEIEVEDCTFKDNVPNDGY